jgi:hypothetical protein
MKQEAQFSDGGRMPKMMGSNMSAQRYNTYVVRYPHLGGDANIRSASLVWNADKNVLEIHC